MMLNPSRYNQPIPDDWFDINWKQRISITVNTGQASVVLSDFPMLVNSTFPSLIGIPRDEIIIVNPDKTVLPHEIQEFDNTTGKLIVWFKKPLVNDLDVTYIYYDNPIALPSEDPVTLWSDYLAVYHMDDISNSKLIDSKGLNDAPLVPGTTQAIIVEGQIGKSTLFPPGLCIYRVPPSVIVGNNEFSFSAWARSDKIIINGMYIPIITDRFLGEGDVHSSLGMNLGDSVMGFGFYVGGWENVSNNVTMDTNMHSYTGSFGPNPLHTLKIHSDGNLASTVFNVGTPPASNQDWNIGQRWDLEGEPEHSWEGIIEEIRISNVYRSDDWVSQEYNNQSNPNAFYAIGDVVIIA